MTDDFVSAEELRQQLVAAISRPDWKSAVRIWHRIFSACEKLSPDDYVAASLAHRFAGEFVSAEVRAEQGVERFPDELEPAAAYADAAFYMGRFDLATTRWLMTINRFADTTPQLYYRASSTLADCNETELAVELLNDGLKHFPQHKQLDDARRTLLQRTQAGTHQFLPPISPPEEEVDCKKWILESFDPIEISKPNLIDAKGEASEAYWRAAQTRETKGELAIREVENAFYITPPGVVTDANGIILPQFYSRNRLFNERILPSFRTTTLKRIEEDTYIFSRRGQDHYYHWTIEMVPLATLSEHLFRHGIDAEPMVVNPAKVQTDWLDLLEKSDRLPRPIRRVYCPEPAVFSFKRLFVPDFPLTYIAPPYNLQYLEQIGHTARADRPAKKRIFASRGRNRVSNEDALMSLFTEYGFEVVNNTDLSLSEQIELYSQADVVAGIHGANLTNAVFMLRGSTLIEIMPNKRLDLSYLDFKSGLDFSHHILFSYGHDETVHVDNVLLNDLERLMATL